MRGALAPGLWTIIGIGIMIIVLALFMILFGGLTHSTASSLTIG